MESGLFENAIVQIGPWRENKGWSVAKSLLGDERLPSPSFHTFRICQRLLDLRQAPPIGINDSRTDVAIIQDPYSFGVVLRPQRSTALKLDTAVVGAESRHCCKGASVQAFDELLMEVIGEYYALPETVSDVTSLPVSDDSIDMIASGRYHHRGLRWPAVPARSSTTILLKSVLGL